VVAVLTGLAVFGVVATCVTRVAIIWLKGRERRRTALSRHTSWKAIVCGMPRGSTMTTLEPDAQAWIEIGSPFDRSESRGER